MNLRRLTSLTPFVLTVLVLGVSACSNNGPSTGEFNDLMDGVPTDPTTYELTVVSCVNDGEFIDYTWGLTNLSDERKTYAFEPYLTNSAGEEEKKSRKLVSESVGPGEYMEWDGAEGGGERFPIGDIECRFEVFDSVFGAFRDEG